MLTKEQILAAPDLKRETVAVPEWGGDVLVTELSAAELGAYLERSFDESGKGRLRGVAHECALAAATMVDEAGHRLFSDEEMAALAAKSPKALRRVADVAGRLNFLTEDARAVAEKN